MSPSLAGTVIIFDLDGTLIDTAGDLAAAMNHALAEAGLAAIPGERVRHLVGHGARAMLARGFAEHGATPSAAELDGHLANFLAHYHAHIADSSRPFPNAVAIIRQLREAGAKTAICTNKREASSRSLIDTLGIADLFDAIVGMDTTSAAKPDPAPVRACLTLTGRERGVFVGDSDTDVKAATAAGLPCLIARFGYGPLTLTADAFAAFDDYRELPALVRAALAR